MQPSSLALNYQTKSPRAQFLLVTDSRQRRDGGQKEN